MTETIERLRKIKRFDQLVAYLRDDLDWPIESDDFEEVTYDWEAEELGIDPKHAAKIQEIKQLRPLASNQQWGIFFVKFEPKQLPVVVMRRLLNKLVIKKRATAKPANQASWRMHDLLFVSEYGVGNERKISFAHFTEGDSANMPTLKVLDWDADDTGHKLQFVATQLSKCLRWPKNTEDQKAWRAQWSSAFTVKHRHVISTAKDLAEQLATLCRSICDEANRVLEIENDKGPFKQLFESFRTGLIHDLTESNFADMFAQTITYGLFSTAVSGTVDDGERSNTYVDTQRMVDLVPITNPFLKEMLSEFLKVGGRKNKIDFDELGINEVVELLRDDRTNLTSVLRDFGNRGRGEDPVIHFYEDFLRQYNKQLKVQRGVFYTPQPVVSYIVRSVHELLQTEFGLEDGLASTVTWGEMASRNRELKIPDGAKPDDPFVVILDPATGTATFLVEVIDIIHRTMIDKWTKEGKNEKQGASLWNEYVPKHLLPRLYGYELMMAPYAIAHIKIGLKLSETGYRFQSEERARIYLTNALEKSDDKQAKLIGFDALAHEAEAVSKIKKSKRFTVIIGNPPYANYSANLSPAARRIVDKYRNFRGMPIRERNQLQFERNIQDDFVKFISIAQDLVVASGVGVFGYITNGTMLASTSLRGMRERLAGDFSRLFELNLHGGGNESIADIKDDENVFDIVQSVAIHVYVRSTPGGAWEVSYADLLGRRTSKYAALASQSVAGTDWRQIQPDIENFGFTPQDEASGGASRRLDSAFVKFGAGIKTNRDAVVIGFDEASLLESVREFDAKLASLKHAQSNIYPLLYRPFDVRRIFYHEDVVASRSLPTMKHVVAGPNIGFVCSSTWTTPDRFSVGISRLMVEMKTGTHDRGTTFFPLYRYQALMGGKAERVHNLSAEFVKEWCAKTRTRFLETGHGDGEMTTGPEDVLFWLYGLFYSPEYRRRYRAALSQRFPIVLLTSNLELFRALARLGGELTSLHLLESPRFAQPITEFIGGQNPEVEKVSWSRDTVWLDKTQTTGFRGVHEPVWNFHIGGYQVCQKWLKDRKGRTLTKDDIAHYHKIVVALSETIRLMAEIDKVIVKHGGWPGAFTTEPVETDGESPETQRSSADASTEQQSLPFK